jgi:hypothetical protein
MHEFVLCGQLDATIERTRPISVPDGDNVLNPCLLSTRDHLVAVRIELLAVKVSMRIDKNQSLAGGHGSITTNRCSFATEASFATSRDFANDR